MKINTTSILIILCLSIFQFNCKNESSSDDKQLIGSKNGQIAKSKKSADGMHDHSHCKHYMKYFNSKITASDYSPSEKLEYKLKLGATNRSGNNCYMLAGCALDKVYEKDKKDKNYDLNEFDVFFLDTKADSTLVLKTILTESRDNYEKKDIEIAAFAVEGSKGCAPALQYVDVNGDNGDGQISGNQILKHLFTLKIDESNEYLPIPFAVHEDHTDCGKVLPLETHYYKLSKDDKDSLYTYIDSLDDYVVALNEDAEIKTINVLGTSLKTCTKFCLVPYKKPESVNATIAIDNGICFNN